MMQGLDVAVIIPTLRRPESLKRAISSVLAQEGVSSRLKEIIVVDNDPEATARDLVEAMASSAQVTLVWCHAPVPGVATARNRGLQETDAPLIAFLDDDEAASPSWLSALLDTQHKLGTDVVFGPISGRVPDGTAWSIYLSDFFGRSGPDTDTEIEHAYGCGNSLMVRASALPGPAPFNVEADQSGGEDDALFASLAERGGRFGWSAQAWVDEFAPAHRARLSYALSRAFAYGQGPSQTAAKQRHWGQVIRWMAIGAAQTLVYGAASLALFLARHPRRIYLYDRTIRGAGKVLWFRGFERNFYGTRELNRIKDAEAISP